MYIHKVVDKHYKSKIIEEVLADLPEWFGLPESTNTYIDEGSNYLLYTALGENNEVIAFLCLKETSIDALEVYCIAVKKRYHRQGIGRQLLNHALKDIDKEYSFIHVKTVDENHYKEYDQTIKFYEAFGFKRLEVIETLWDEHNPCLLMIKAL